MTLVSDGLEVDEVLSSSSDEELLFSDDEELSSLSVVLDEALLEELAVGRGLVVAGADVAAKTAAEAENATINAAKTAAAFFNIDLFILPLSFLTPHS